MPVAKMSVEGNLGKEVGMSVRSTGEGSIVQLTGVRSCQSAGQYNRAADELFGVLDGEPERPLFILSSTVGSEAWNSRDLKSRPH